VSSQINGGKIAIALNNVCRGTAGTSARRTQMMYGTNAATCREYASYGSPKCARIHFSSSFSLCHSARRKQALQQAARAIRHEPLQNQEIPAEARYRKV
jgi:hypothetical protein